MAMGIFCLETAAWEKVVKNQDSYDHFLRFLETSESGGIRRYRHFDVATKGELVFFLKKWKRENTQKDFPFLYLAFHGSEAVKLPNGEKVSSDELTNVLYGERYDHAFIHFSSCYLAKHGSMKKLLYNTGALSVSGYMNEEGVDWYTAVAFELLYLTELSRFGLPKTSREMRNFVNSYFATHEEMKFLAESLRFHMWYRVDKSDLDTDHPDSDYITPCPVKELEKVEDEESS